MSASSTTWRSAAAAKCCRRRSVVTSPWAWGVIRNLPSRSRRGSCARSAITSDKRLAGINIPTLKEQGINVEFVNWRGLMAAPGISEAQRQARRDEALPKWSNRPMESTVAKNGWVDLFIAGDDFKRLRPSPSRRMSLTWSIRLGAGRRDDRAFPAIHPGELLLSLGLIALGSFVIYDPQSIPEIRRVPWCRAASVSLHHRRRADPVRRGPRLAAISGGWRNVPLDQEGHDPPGLARLRHHQRRHRSSI